MWYQPGHQALNIKSINTLTGHQALNIRAKAHRGSSPQRKEQRLTGHQALKSMTREASHSTRYGEFRRKATRLGELETGCSRELDLFHPKIPFLTSICPI
ncbi:hypothetical protein MTR_4g073750 [Medicago truncatula]|uniref:Uncharacterized protein n=1 Tax=Medicago truncatula TaxID=3880 RepID=A0A072UN95_MEDTR|nr:hypothetical protein MTR_4g073750 [Medicago truncatula]